MGGGLGTPLYGYRAWTPGYTFQEAVGQRINRFIGSANANWRPTSWLQNRLSVGNDYTNRVDDNLLRRGDGPPLTATYRDGFKFNDRTDVRNFTVDLGSTASYNPMPWLGLKTTGGVQYVNYLYERGSGGGEQLAPGSSTTQGGATPSASEATTQQKTLGLFVEQAAAINERPMAIAAIRLVRLLITWILLIESQREVVLPQAGARDRAVHAVSTVAVFVWREARNVLPDHDGQRATLAAGNSRWQQSERFN